MQIHQNYRKQGAIMVECLPVLGNHTPGLPARAGERITHFFGLVANETKKRMLKNICRLVLLLFVSANSVGQVKTDPLFDNQEPLDITVRLSIKEIKKTKEDSTYHKHVLHYKNAAGSYDSLSVKIKSRGNFRFRTCYYPPLFIKIKKSQAINTPFAGNKRIKLVLPCRSSQGGSEIMREFICYKLFEKISQYSFRTRLANVEFNEIKRNKITKTPLKAIIIEDIGKVAERFGAIPKGDLKLHAQALQDTCAMRFYLFQYLIANTDWSAGYQHNTKLIYRKPRLYYSIPYDFDMSGVVDAPYSVVSQVGNTELEIDHVTQRLYRGFCVNPGVAEFVRHEFIAKKEMLLAIPAKYTAELRKNEAKRIRDFLEKFFEVIEDNNSFRRMILEKCRE